MTYDKIRNVRKCKKRADNNEEEAYVTTLMTQFDLAELNRFEFVEHFSFRFLKVPRNLWVFVTFDKALP